MTETENLRAEVDKLWSELFDVTEKLDKEKEYARAGWNANRDSIHRAETAEAGLKEHKKALQNVINNGVTMAAILDSVEAILDGGDIDEFMGSFGIVRKVEDFRAWSAHAFSALSSVTVERDQSINRAEAAESEVRHLQAENLSLMSRAERWDRHTEMLRITKMFQDGKLPAELRVMEIGNIEDSAP